MDPLSASGAPFHTTQWNLVLVSGEADRPRADEALADLCRSYWPPLYAFARRQRLTPHDAQDAVQAFFLHLLERRLFARADPRRGRFRGFLLGTFKHFLAHERERASALKRGGGLFALSLDAGEGEALAGLATEGTPDDAFERRWALTVLERALAALGEEAAARGKARFFAALRPFLTAEGEAARYEEAAAELGVRPGSLKTAVHRLRHDFRAALRREVARTLHDVREVEAELQHLREVLGSTGLM